MILSFKFSNHIVLCHLAQWINPIALIQPVSHAPIARSHKSIPSPTSSQCRTPMACPHKSPRSSPAGYVCVLCSWSQVSAFQHYNNLPLTSSLSQSLSSPPRPYTPHPPPPLPHPSHPPDPTLTIVMVPSYRPPTSCWSITFFILLLSPFCLAFRSVSVIPSPPLRSPLLAFNPAIHSILVSTPEPPLFFPLVISPHHSLPWNVHLKPPTPLPVDLHQEFQHS